MKLTTPIAFLTLGVLITSCNKGTTTVATETPDKDNAPKLVKVGGVEGVQMSPESLKLAGITVISATSSSLSTSMQPTGEVAPTDSGTIQITPRLGGKITEALVSVGDRVHKGQVIGSVDSVDLAQAEAAYATAVSHANLTRNQLHQQKKLAGFGSLSEQPLEDARKASFAADAAISSDEAQIRVDALALENTKRLVAMGEITRKPVEDAQNAHALAQSALTQATVTLHSAKANVDRAKILIDGGIYSKQQFEDAEASYKSAIAGEDQAKTAEKLSKEELNRQETIYKENLNGSGSLQGAQSKLQQDNQTYRNDLEVQRLAHTQYERAKAVRKSGIPISSALQAAQDTYDAALIAEQSAGNTLKMYGIQPGSSVGQLRNGRVVIPIVSPIEGLVAARAMVVGQNVDMTAVLARVVNLDKVYVDAQIYEKDVQGVSAGDSVQISVTALPNHPFTGKVQNVASEVNPDTRTVTVRTVIDNHGWLLRPGMYASILIGSHKSIHAIALPTEAILQEDEKQIVYVQAAAGQFVKRVVKLGAPIGGKVPIISGLSPGDQVVVSGNVFIEKEQEKLQSGKSGS
jgi:RND family efflux transporter MFP subunit